MIRKDIREANWEECLFYKTARKTSPENSRANSLVKTSIERAKYLSSLGVNEQSANFLFESYYSCVIELLQAITIRAGYNILNHLCLGYYLRDVLKKQILFHIFDFCRFKRNGLIYYGKMMNFAVAQNSLEQAKRLFEELKNIVNNFS